MNRPFNLEIERELLRAAEENPGLGLVLGSDGIAKPAEAGLIQAEAAGPVAGEGVDWAVVGPKLAEAAKEALLLAVKRQADGGDLYDFQDTLRVCAGKLRPFLRYA